MMAPSLPRTVVVARRKKLLLRNLKSLVRGPAPLAKQDLDRVSSALPVVADRHQVVADRVRAKVQDRAQRAISADFAAVDLVE